MVLSGYCYIKPYVFFDEESDGNIPEAWGGPKTLVIKEKHSKYLYKKFQKLIFDHKPTPDGLPDLEKFYPGVLGHAELDFDGPWAPKQPKTNF